MRIKHATEGGITFKGLTPPKKCTKNFHRYEPVKAD